MDPKPEKVVGTPALREGIRFLRSRNRLVAEVRAHLTDRGFPSEEIESVIRFLLEKKLLNDARTTEQLVERKSGKRAVGTERLRAELEILGAPADIMALSLGGLGSESDRALDALRAKYKSGADRGKAGRFLFSRGFAEEAIESALDAFCAPLS